MKKRIFSILLCLSMVLMLFPVTALAEDTDLQNMLNNAEPGESVKLNKDYTIDTTLQVSGHVTLDLNGHVIKMTGSGSVIKVGDGGNLTLQDSSAAKTGVITGGNSGNGGGVYVAENGSFTMSGGTIFGCAAFDNGGGGGVYVGGGSFTMTGGAISGCSSNDGGGGVFVGGGSFTMTGGTISDCSAIKGGDAIAAIDNSTINANGGTIYSEVASFGQILNTSTSGCTEFYGEVKNFSTIDGSGTISGGIFEGEVINRSGADITGGTFRNRVQNNGNISGGIYYGKVENYGTISGGMFYGNISGSIISGKTVTFMKDGSRYALEVVSDDNKVVAPVDPTQDDYIFTGWYTDQGLTNKYQFGQTLPEGITLYAGFEPAPVLAITVNGFQVGNTPKDITLSFASTILGITFSADDILRSIWDQCIVGEMGRDAWHTIPDDEVFQADTRYKCYIYLDNNGLMEAPAVTVNGKTPEYCEIATIDGVSHKILIECELGTPEPPVLAITVNGFQVGNTPKDITLSFASTIPGVTFSKDDIKYVGWEKYVLKVGRYVHVAETEVFEADTSYRCVIELDNKGLDTVPAVTMNGKTPEYCGIVEEDRVPVALQMDCELGTPALPPITLTVPFTTTVVLGGSTAPGETTFELALIDGSGNELKYDGMYFDAVVTTDGAGNYTGTMTLTGPFQQLWNMLCDGAFVKQVDGGEEGWTYDDTVWGLLLKEAIALASTDDAAPEYTALIYPTYIKDDGSFAPDLNAYPVDRMSFTNTYTYSVPVRDTATIIIGGEKEGSKPVEENPNTGAPVAANMSTLSVLTLAAAVAVLKTRKR